MLAEEVTPTCARPLTRGNFSDNLVGPVKAAATQTCAVLLELRFPPILRCLCVFPPCQCQHCAPVPCWTYQGVQCALQSTIRLDISTTSCWLVGLMLGIGKTCRYIPWTRNSKICLPSFHLFWKLRCVICEAWDSRMLSESCRPVANTPWRAPT
jgi:hypothetical protein